MTKLLRPVAALAALIGGASLGAWAVCSDPEPPPVAVKVAAKPAALKCAVEPKALSETVKKGLTFLAGGQQEDGGWTQGGGWRTGAKGGERVEGQAVADPSDVGNTCLVLLAFFRAGHTATEGDYKDAVKKGLKFVFERVEKADGKDLYVTDVRNTQLQSKIGPFADTFLATLMLSELKGHAGPDDARLAKCLDKALDKMGKNQQADGTFAGNGGWAPVLSQGVANKALARARQNGAAVNDELIARATTQSRAAAKGSEMAAAPADRVAGKPGAFAGRAGPGGRASGGFPGGGLGGGDAGVPLYGRGQASSNLQDVVNSANADAAKAKAVIADPKAPQAQKDAAKKTVTEAEALNAENGLLQNQVVKEARDGRFVAGFGSNGGEEFLSFLNLSETMLVRGGKDWTDWDGKMQEMLPKAQDKNGSWSGHHCITGKTFCTASALLVLMADRTKFPEDVLAAAREEAKKEAAKTAAEKKPDAKTPAEKK
jgi:hypothetical protein